MKNISPCKSYLCRYSFSIRHLGLYGKTLEKTTALISLQSMFTAKSQQVKQHNTANKKHRWFRFPVSKTSE